MRGHVGEGSVPVVVVENAASIAEYEQIGEAVVVVVADGYAHSEQTLGAHAGAGGDVGKGAVAVIAVKRASQRLRWACTRAVAAPFTRYRSSKPSWS